MKNFFIVPLFCFLISFPGNAAGNLDSTVEAGIRQIYSLQYSAAETTFRSLIADYPGNPSGRFFLAMVDWWKILVDLDNESYDDIFFQKLEDVIFQCDKILARDSTNIDALFFKGGAIGFRGRLHGIRESWLKAADDGREALPIVQHAARLQPDNVDVQLGFGIYNYYAAVIPQEYPLIKPLMVFFPSGDKAKGIAQLEETARNGRYAKFEARYFLMTLFHGFERDYSRAYTYARMLYNDFPANPVFQRWYGRIAVSMGDAGVYEPVFRDVYNRCAAKETGYVDKAKREAAYYLGVYYRNNSKADSALFYFEQCEALSRKVEKSKQSGFLINAVLYCGMMNDALGRRERAVEYYNKVLAMNDYASSRQQASMYLQTPYQIPGGNQ